MNCEGNTGLEITISNFENFKFFMIDNKNNNITNIICELFSWKIGLKEQVLA